MVKRGAKRARDSLPKQMPSLNQIIWKADTTDIQQGTMDTVVAMGVFARANFNSVLQLSLVLGEKEKELQKAKQDLEEEE